MHTYECLRTVELPAYRLAARTLLKATNPSPLVSFIFVNRDLSGCAGLCYFTSRCLAAIGLDPPGRFGKPPHMLL